MTTQRDYYRRTPAGICPPRHDDIDDTVVQSIAARFNDAEAIVLQYDYDAAQDHRADIAAERQRSKANYGSVSPLGKSIQDYRGKAPFRSASDYDGGAAKDKNRKYNTKLYFCPHCKRGYQGRDARLLASTCCIDHITIVVQYNCARDNTLHYLPASRHWYIDVDNGTIHNEHDYLIYVLHKIQLLDDGTYTPIWRKPDKVR